MLYLNYQHLVVDKMSLALLAVLVVLVSHLAFFVLVALFFEGAFFTGLFLAGARFVVGRLVAGFGGVFFTSATSGKT